MSIKFLVVLLAVAAVAHGEESENALETSFVELAPTGEFTLCLRETPSSCITVDGKEDTDGVGLKLSPRGPAANQKYKLADGFLSVSNKPTRVIGQEHGANAKLATGGRIWIFAKSLARSDDQQWVLKGEDVKGATQICLKNHPAACLGTAADNSIILQVANAAPSWVLRPTDPCVGNPCGSNSKCTGNNADGSFKCTCNAGYEASAGSNRCFEVDACQRTPRPCDPNADCTKTGPGLFNCKCRPGFSGNGKTCAEIDPCAASVNPCGKNGDCVKTGPDAFHCKCKKGFAPESATSCIEIDACQSSPCDPNAICTKTGPGTNTCTCKVGYKGNGFKCKEVPACLALPCPEHSSCSPLGPGLRKCTCLPGYEFPEDNERVCKPINNCESSPCKGVNMKCTRTGPAKHICECEKGFVPLADNPLACDKPGSKNVLEAETRVKLNQVRKIIQSRIDEQKRKENAARSEREALERDFAKRQKQRQDAIRLLEKRVRELISDRTQARVSDRDARLTALRERIAILEKEELDAVNLAKEQIAVIKSLEAAEAKKLTGVEAELNAATQRILEETRKYARELREKLKKDHDALVEQAKKDEARRQAEAAKAEQERTAAAAAASNDYKPNPPPRVGDPALNNFAEVEAVAKDEQETEEEGEEEEEDENQESEEQESL